MGQAASPPTHNDDYDQLGGRLQLVHIASHINSGPMRCLLHIYTTILETLQIDGLL